MQKFPMTAPGLQRLEDELRMLKSEERPCHHPADRRGADPWRSIGERRIPCRARTPVLHRGPHRRAGGDRLGGRGDRPVRPVRQPREVRRPCAAGGRGDREGIDLPDRRRARGGHQGGRLSISSPLAKALIGKKVGDTVSVPAPGGDRSVRDPRTEVQVTGRAATLHSPCGRGLGGGVRTTTVAG